MMITFAIVEMFRGGHQPGWMIVIAVMTAMSCALLGNFLILRRMSMMGDAISHAVLPGLVIAYLMVGSRGAIPMLAGGMILGVLTAVFSEWIHKRGRVEAGAAMGVVFTTLFAIGIVLIQKFARGTDLDVDCVLSGNLEAVALQAAMPIVAGVIQMPISAWTIGITLIVNVIFVIVFWKELKISSFDPALATTMGINANIMQYALMGLVAMTTVACFEAVGSIIVIAMLIVPGAAAHLLTDRLNVMVWLSLLFAAMSGVLGYWVAMEGPGWIGYESDTFVSGGMTMVAGVLFVIVFLFAPQRGLISQVVRRFRLSLRILQEDAIGLLYRVDEMHLVDESKRTPDVLQEAVGAGAVSSRLALWRLRSKGLVELDDTGYHLTDQGRVEAGNLVRSHRLWETYLLKHAQVPSDHVHDTAELLEHITDAELRRRLDLAADQPDVDPHGKSVPIERDSKG